MLPEEYETFSDGLHKLVTDFTNRTGQKMLLLWGIQDDGFTQEGFSGSDGITWAEACTLMVGSVGYVSEWYGENGGTEKPIKDFQRL